MDALEKRQFAEMAVYANVAKGYRDSLAAQSTMETPQKQKEAAALIVATAHSTKANETANSKDALAGREILEKAYGKKADDIASVLSGRAANYDLPKGAARTEDMNKLVRKGQDIADNVVSEQFRSRGQVNAIGPNGNYMEIAARESESKEKLVQHMLNVKASIEAQVERKTLDREQANFAYQRIQKETFNRETPKASRDFAEFEKTTSARLSRDVSSEVDRRYAEQSKLVARTNEKEALAQRDAANKAKANDFRTLDAKDATTKHPDLLNAYAVIKAADVLAQQKFTEQNDRVKFVSLMKERIAQNIEQNKPLPEVKLKDNDQSKRQEAPALER